jgi:DNA-binding NtrC family response regulator
MDWKDSVDEVRLVGRSRAHATVLARLAKVGPTRAEVLISGPTGVGKELYARYLHARSRRPGTFVPVDCGAIPNQLFESELFGHAAGAFTGAQKSFEGLVAAAEGGTLLFDEVHTLSPENQVKLLRFLQSKQYRRLGETRLRNADVRIAAATNLELIDEAKAGRFREDLFFRLHVVPVRISGLAERSDDIEVLVEYFAERFAARYGNQTLRFSAEAMAFMRSYSWPGNVRELENCVHCLACLANDSREVQRNDLELIAAGRDLDTEVYWDFDKPFQAAKAELVDRFEQAYVREALSRTAGNISQAARASGKPRRSFFELMRRHEIRASEFRP